MGVPAPVHRAPPSRRSTWSKCQTPENKTGNTNKKSQTQLTRRVQFREWMMISYRAPCRPSSAESRTRRSSLSLQPARGGSIFYQRSRNRVRGGGERSREGSLHLLFQELALNKVGQMNVVVLRCHLPNGWRTR